MMKGGEKKNNKIYLYDPLLEYMYIVIASLKPESQLMKNSFFHQNTRSGRILCYIIL